MVDVTVGLNWLNVNVNEYIFKRLAVIKMKNTLLLSQFMREIVSDHSKEVDVNEMVRF